MAKSSREGRGPSKRAMLVMARVEAEALISAQIDRGNELLRFPINNQSELDAAQGERRKWNTYNEELLQRIADSDDLLERYRPSVESVPLGAASVGQWAEYERRTIRDRIVRLESIQQLLGLIPESNEVHRPVSVGHSQPVSGNRLFLVHGRDERPLHETARFLDMLGLPYTILREQPSKGRTIIEKFEDYSNVAFAVVLLTADDRGGPVDVPYEQQQLRARQNVILELGYFIGKLGRERVCALYQEDVEIPSDYSGVLFVPLDKAGAWKLGLARELKEAGLDVDLNRAI